MIKTKIPKDLAQRNNNSTRNKNCSVLECDNTCYLVVSQQEYEGSMNLSKLGFERNKLKRIYLCRKHYSIVKKKTIKENVNKKGFLENQVNYNRNRKIF